MDPVHVDFLDADLFGDLGKHPTDEGFGVSLLQDALTEGEQP